LKITIIRHAKVDFTGQAWCTAKEFNRGNEDYDVADIIRDKKYHIKTSNPVYISGLIRTKETARLIFGNEKFHKTALCNEVPICAFTNKNLNLPTRIWEIVARILWIFNSKRQPETYRQTKKRANDLINHLELEKKDCYIVSHGVFMRVFRIEMKKRGYCLGREKNHASGIENLERFVYIK